jgi:hypothetical protein
LGADDNRSFASGRFTDTQITTPLRTAARGRPMRLRTRGTCVEQF